MSNKTLLIQTSEIEQILSRLELMLMTRQPIDPVFGLCFNLSYTVGDYYLNGYEIVSNLAPKWEHFSGNREYPVQRPAQWRQSSGASILWVGEQLELRMSLAEYISRRLNEQLKLAREKNSPEVEIPWEPL